MELTQQEFLEDAQVLLKALQCVSVRGEDNIKPYLLSNWELECDESNTENCIYWMSHSPVTSYHPYEEISEEEYFELEDSTIPIDPQQYIMYGVQNNKVIQIQWKFSIVYSDTYRVPVLYFHVQNLNGEPCERAAVLQWLPPSGMEDSWEFVSQEEHPCTGLPSYFLHPCQTSRLLKIVRAEEQSSISPIWTWMSMTLPAVNKSIPAAYFLLVQNEIQKVK